MDGEVTLASAEEVKGLLLQWLSSGKDLDLDLESANQIDIAILQLLWAATREAGQAGVAMKARLSAAAQEAVRDSGFTGIAGEALAR
jgi:anti-anti-sigma regulatory factor